MILCKINGTQDDSETDDWADTNIDNDTIHDIHPLVSDVVNVVVDTTHTTQ